MAKEQERFVTLVRRDRKKSLAHVEYHDKDGVNRKEADPDRPPTQSMHDAFDGLATHVGAPYYVDTSSRRLIRVTEVALDKGGDDNRLRVRWMKGFIDAEGFDGTVPLRVPLQEPTGDLLKAINKLVDQAAKYIDGARGQVTIDDA